MRTRVFNKMLASEVEEYLARGGESIFVGVGVVEVHGGSPLDVEQIFPEALALAMAEEYDGLAMINIPYMFPGGTIVSNATVQMSVEDSMSYLKKILHSLVAQGFKKIYLLSGHGPARLYINAVQRDFFQETKVHVFHVNTLQHMMAYTKSIGLANPFQALSMTTYGAYKMLHQEDYLPVDPEGKSLIDPKRMEIDPRLKEMQDACSACGAQAAIYYGKPEEHGGNDAPFKTIEERDAACEKGEAMIREIVKLVPIPRLSAALDGYNEYLAEVMEKYPRLKGQY